MNLRNLLLKGFAFLLFSLFLVIPLVGQSQTVRLKEVPLVEDIEGEKKKFKFDFRGFIPDAPDKASKIYLISRFCYKGQNFIVRRTASSPRFTFTVKYYVDQWLEIRINSYEGPAYCIGEFRIDDFSLMRCNPLGIQLEWVKVDSTATDFKRS